MEAPNIKFKLISYEWHGADDLDFNIFNNEKLPSDTYIGTPSHSTFSVEVNEPTLYIKQYNVQDGPFGEDVFIGVSETKDFKKIEWYVYNFGNGQNNDLIDIIGLLSVALRDEDFVYSSDGMLGYYDNFEKVELNIDIDVNKLKNMWEEFNGF
ncbi:hypothetical protein [uncultured Polaribacter sp.]|uniref:hypothetical protein n=1 Tax=uncultured Polaribacter sp. TaxID=174711 RepID=UPI002633D6E3|nr:hypothetical protein [uncultured Polaribacter sp.]